jgi:hypothetical protein
MGQLLKLLSTDLPLKTFSQQSLVRIYMSGPESLQNNPQASTPSPETPRFSPEELGKANEIITEARSYTGGFGVRFNRAAESLGYTGGYKDVPERIRSAVSHLANEVRARRAKEKKEAELRRKEKVRASEEAKEAKRRADEASALAEQQLRDAEEAERSLDIAHALELENDPLTQAVAEWEENYLLHPQFRYAHGDPEIDPGILLGPKEFDDSKSTK